MSSASTPYSYVHANDGARLAYQAHGQPGKRTIILLHGFTGSSKYFSQNFEALSKECRVIAPDLRGHGASEKTQRGHHIARLAADLNDLLRHLKKVDGESDYLGVGCSLGCAVLWCYTEMYAASDFRGMVFVDQAPLQDRREDGSWGEKQANYGCYDAASLAKAQALLREQPDEFYKGLVSGCLGYRHAPGSTDRIVPAAETQADEEFFVGISRQGDPVWFAKLLADHTSYDHRDTISALLSIPVLVLGARFSGSFPLLGLQATAELVNTTRPGTAEFRIVDSGHWMFYEDVTEFDELILGASQKFFARSEKANLSSP